MVDLSLLSWPAILVATIASMLIGALWYSPILPYTQSLASDFAAGSRAGCRFCCARHSSA
jgi:hypothetical protein